MPDKEVKEMDIRMLTKCESEMKELKENSIRVRKYNKEPSRAEEYSNRNEKYISRNQQIS